MPRHPGEARGRRPLHVALVNMPFALAHLPSIQCGLLKATLLREGHAVDVHYLNLETAVVLGPETYRGIAEYPHRDVLLGDWLFGAAAFGPRADEDDYLHLRGSIGNSTTAVPIDLDQACRFRRLIAPALVEQWATTIPWSNYDLVGFTCTFEQTVAAHALGRRIKALHPEVMLVYGGANFEGGMGQEHVRAFSWVDYAVVGEADRALPELANQLAGDGDPVQIPGVICRLADNPQPGRSAAPVQELDALPYPDYSDYMAALIRLGGDRVLGERPPLLTFEGSRGCWWGEKHHCTFCGINGGVLAFRAKSPQRILDELRHLSSTYRIPNFIAVDTIMDPRFLEGVCRPIADGQIDFTLGLEVKANMTREQIRLLAHGGVRMIQPGIESLSTRVLQLMRKGSSMLINLRLLKWAYYYGMQVSWNLLAGFPSETPEDYRCQERLLPLLHHLPPPDGCGPIWIERFSPYFTDDSSVRNLAPKPAYRFVWPEDAVCIEKIAYFFSGEIVDTLSVEEYRPLLAAAAEWKRIWFDPDRPRLTYTRTPDWIQITDSRSCRQSGSYLLREERALAYEYCGDTHRGLRAIRDNLRSRGHFEDLSVDFATVRTRDMLRELCDLGLMVEERDCYLSLALPENGCW